MTSSTEMLEDADPRSPDKSRTRGEKKVGRPSNKSVNYKDGEHWVDTMIREYKAGASDVEVCSELEIPYSQFKKRIDTDGTFYAVVEIGRLFAQAWWEKQARSNLLERAFNHNLWYNIMKNRYGYADRTINVDEKPASEMSKDELISRILDKSPKIRSLLLDRGAIDEDSLSNYG